VQLRCVLAAFAALARDRLFGCSIMAHPEGSPYLSDLPSVKSVESVARLFRLFGPGALGETALPFPIPLSCLSRLS